MEIECKLSVGGAKKVFTGKGPMETTQVTGEVKQCTGRQSIYYLRYNSNMTALYRMGGDQELSQLL